MQKRFATFSLHERGFTHLFVILLGILLIGGLVIGGSFYFKAKTSKETALVKQTSSSPVEPTEQELIYRTFLFKFSIPRGYSVQIDTEEDFYKRSKGDFRKNFTNYIGYPPPKFVDAYALLDSSKDFENSPFVIWIFDNPENFTIEKWFDEYWYYPFVWGDFTERRKAFEPVNEIQIGEQIGKYGIVTYRPDSPKFIYLSLNGKMYMFRILNNNASLEKQVLESFKFLNSNQINSFEDCQKAGYPVTKAYPGKCSTPDGRSFIQELSEEEKEGLKPPKDNLE